MKKSLIYSLLALALVFSGSPVFAETSATPPWPGPDDLLPTGYVQLSNLKIDSVSGATLPATITASTDVGSECKRFDSAAATFGRIVQCTARPTLVVTLQITEKTTLLLQNRRSATFADFKVGDRINVYGFHEAGSLVVQAYILRNLDRASSVGSVGSQAPIQQFFQLNNVEVLRAPDSATLPATMTVVQYNRSDCVSFSTATASRGSVAKCPGSTNDTSGQKYDVTMSSGTTILNRVRSPMRIADIAVGDKLNIYGSYVSSDPTVVIAQIVRDLSQPRSGVGSIPTPVNEVAIASLSPSSDSIGATVRISGRGFAEKGNTINFGPGAILNVSPRAAITSQGTQELLFEVPPTLKPVCIWESTCKIVEQQVLPGNTYLVSVTNSNGTSNTLKFLVTATTTASTVSVTDFGAIANDSSDDAPAIQRAIDSLPSGGVVLFPTGTYLLGTSAGGVGTFPNGQLKQTALLVKGSNVTLRGEGGGSVLKLMNGRKMRVVSVTGSNVGIEKLLIDGNKAGRNGSVPYPDGDVMDALVYAEGASNLTVRNIEVKDGIEDGIGFWLSDGGAVVDSYSHDNGTVAAGGTGVSYSRSKNGYIARNTFARNTAVNVWIAFGSDTVTLEDNIIKDALASGVALGGDAPGSPEYVPNKNFTVRRNVVTGNAWDGIGVIGIENSSIESNSILDNGGSGMTLSSQDARYPLKNLSVRDNKVNDTVAEKKQQVGIWAHSGTLIDLRRNIASNNGIGLWQQIAIDSAAGVNADWQSVNTISYGSGSAGTNTTTTIATSTINAPSVMWLNPTSGDVGWGVSITGNGFTATGNTVLFGGGAIPNLSSTNNGSNILFTVPDSISPECLFSTPACSVATQVTSPGNYPVSVKNANGISNAITFTVTNSEKTTISGTTSLSQLAALLESAQAFLQALANQLH